MLNESQVDATLPTPGVWYGRELQTPQWRMTIPAAVIGDLDAALDQSAPARGAQAGELAHVQAFVERVQQRLFHGTGVVVASQLPVREWGIERARRAVAVLAHAMGSPTEQTHDGITQYAVEDRGEAAGAAVRRSLTNVAQPWHSDGPWVRQPPSVVGLYCLRAARDGGASQCLSFRALVGDLTREEPQLAARLARNVYWHRQSEHDAAEPPISEFPLVWHDEAGEWCGRLYADYVINGYRAAEQPMDAELRHALERVQSLADEAHRALRFRLQDGDIAWLNNRWCVHARSAFEAAASVQDPRLLMRVWHRREQDRLTLDT